MHKTITRQHPIVSLTKVATRDDAFLPNDNVMGTFKGRMSELVIGEPLVLIESDLKHMIITSPIDKIYGNMIYTINSIYNISYEN